MYLREKALLSLSEMPWIFLIVKTLMKLHLFWIVNSMPLYEERAVFILSQFFWFIVTILLCFPKIFLIMCKQILLAQNILQSSQNAFQKWMRALCMFKARFPQLHLEFPPKPQKEKQLTNDIYGTMYNTHQIYMTFFIWTFLAKQKQTNVIWNSLQLL